MALNTWLNTERKVGTTAGGGNGNVGGARFVELKLPTMVALPDFFRSSFKIQLPLVLHFRNGVTGGQDFHTNFWRNFKCLLPFDQSKAFGGIPTYVRSLNSVDRRYRTFGQRMVAKVFIQQNRQSSLSTAVAAGRRRFITSSP